MEERLPNVVRRCYLIYDIMQLSGRADIARCDQATRLQCIQREREREIIASRELAVRPISNNVGD